MQLRPRTARLTLAVAAAALAVELLAPGALAANVSPRRAMVRVTNASREDHGVRHVHEVGSISDLVRKHSLMMARTGKLAHTKNPAKAYLEGRVWNSWGENVGVGGGSIADMQAAFMRSTGHRTNVLNPAFEHVAVGVVRRDGLLWVTVFFWG